MAAFIVKMKNLLKKHTHVLLIGFVISLIVASPHIRALIIVGPENFEGVYPTFSDDEITYQARIKEVVEGNFSIGNPYIKEHKNDAFIMPPVAESIVALIVWLTHTSVPFVTFICDFFITFVAWIFVYKLFRMFTKESTWFAILCTLLFFVFSLSSFGRPISPQFNGLFLFGGIIAITYIFFHEGIIYRKRNLIAGLITGITCFISPYYFTALLTLYFTIFFLDSLFERNINMIKKNIPWFLVTFLPFSLLYWFFHLKASSGPFYNETMVRYGLIQTHLPGSFTNLILGFFAVLVLFGAWRMLSHKELTYSVSAIASIFILNLQNIITGTSLQFTSHYRLVTILFVFISTIIIFTAFRSKNHTLSFASRNIIIVPSIILVLFIVTMVQKNEVLTLSDMPYTQSQLIDEQRKMEIFKWFNNNTPEDSVVYTLGDDYDFLLPVYTKNRVYYNFYAALYPAGDFETEDRWLRQQLFEESLSTTTIRDRQREFWGNTYLDAYQSKQNRRKILSFILRNRYVPEERVPENRVLGLFTRYNEIKKEPITDSLLKYQLNFILLSENYPYFKMTKERLETMQGVTLLVTINRVLIYEIKNQ